MKKIAIGGIATVLLSLSIAACSSTPTPPVTPKVEPITSGSQNVGINVKVNEPKAAESVGVNVKVNPVKK